MVVAPRGTQTWCRVLVVEHGVGLWGAGLYLMRLAPLLAERGVEQVLAAPAFSELARAWREAGRTHVPINIARDRRLTGPRLADTARRITRETFRNVRGARELARATREHDIDVLHANSNGWSYTEVIGASRLTRRPAVMHLHVQLAPGLLGRFWGHTMLRGDAVVAVSRAAAHTLPGGGTDPRVHVIPNGIDPAEFAPGPRDPGARAELTANPSAPVVLVVARIDRSKGIEDVVRAVGALPPALSGTALAIVGGSSDRRDADYEAHVRRLGAELLGDRLRMLGNRSDVARLIRAADVVVLASETEGFGLCVLEAQASGVPPVAYPAGGVAELIMHGVDGLLARQGDVDDLSRQLAEVLGDPVLAARLGQQARQRVLAQRTLERQADAQVEVLRSIMNRRRAAGTAEQDADGARHSAARG